MVQLNVWVYWVSDLSQAGLPGESNLIIHEMVKALCCHFLRHGSWPHGLESSYVQYFLLWYIKTFERIEHIQSKQGKMRGKSRNRTCVEKPGSPYIASMAPLATFPFWHPTCHRQDALRYVLWVHQLMYRLSLFLFMRSYHSVQVYS